MRRTFAVLGLCSPIVCGVACLPADAMPIPCVLDCCRFGERGRVARGHLRRGCIVPPLRLRTEGRARHSRSAVRLARILGGEFLYRVHVAAPAFVSRQVPSVKSCPWTSVPCCSCCTRGAAVGAGCHRRPSTDGSVVTTGRPEVGSPRGRPIDRTAVWCSRRRRRVLGVAPASCTRDVGCHYRSSAGGCRVAGAGPLRRVHSYLVDPASSHMLVSKTKPCMSKYERFVL